MVGLIDSTAAVSDNPVRFAFSLVQRAFSRSGVRMERAADVATEPTGGYVGKEAAPLTAWLSPPPERPLPRNLDLPIGLFDPGALLAEPREASRAVRSLVHRPAACAHEERIDARVRRAA